MDPDRLSVSTAHACRFSGWLQPERADIQRRQKEIGILHTPGIFREKKRE